MLNEAVDYYSRCLTVDPYFLTGYIGRGEAHGDAGNVVLSRRDYQKALRLNPTCLPARINLGYSLQVNKIYLSSEHSNWWMSPVF